MQRSPRAALVLLSAILALAAAVRLYGLTYGLPYLYSADEAQVVLRALGMGTGDLNPHFFHWPASPLIYTLFGLFGVYYLAGSLAGAFPSTQEFAVRVLADPSGLVVLARGLVALTGIGSVYLNYWLTARFFNSSSAGLAAALLLALSPLHVTISKWALADAPMMLGIQLFLLACYLVWARGHLRHYLLAGAMVGLAVSLKYSAAFVSPALVAAHWAGRTAWPLGKRIVHPWIAWAGVASVAAFVLATPFSVLAFPEFRRDLAYISAYVYEGQPWATPSIPPGLHVLVNLLPAVLGVAVAVIAGIGVAYAAYCRTPADVILLTGLVCAYVSISLARTQFGQYAVPLLAFLTILAARVLAEVAGKLPLAPGVRYAFLGAALAAAVARPFAEVVQYDYTLAQKDTRTEAKEWIEANIPGGAKVLMDGGRDLFTVSPPLRHNRVSVERRIAQARGDEPGKARYWEVVLRMTGEDGYDLYPIQGDLLHWTVNELRRAGFQYVVVSSYIQGRIMSGEAPSWDPEAVTLSRSLRTEATLVRTFAPRQGQPGPALWVFQIP